MANLVLVQYIERGPTWLANTLQARPRAGGGGAPPTALLRVGCRRLYAVVHAWPPRPAAHLYLPGNHHHPLLQWVPSFNLYLGFYELSQVRPGACPRGLQRRLSRSTPLTPPHLPPLSPSLAPQYAFLADRTGGTGLTWGKLRDERCGMASALLICGIEALVLMAQAVYLEQVGEGGDGSALPIS